MKLINIAKLKILTLFMILMSIIMISTACQLTNESTEQTKPDVTTATITTTKAGQSTEPDEQTENTKVFNLDELAKFNGKNGNPAYVAVDGKVYDVSDVPEWKNGIHNNRFEAGRDLTKELKLSPHGKSKLDLVPMVGTLAN